MTYPCPRCGQAWIEQAIIKPTGQRIAICPECDTMWQATAVIALRTAMFYETFMEQRGYSNSWGQLERLGADLSDDVAYEPNPLIDTN